MPPPTCAWCDKPATREVTVEPARTNRIQTTGKPMTTTGTPRREPACEDHAHPDKRTDPPRAKKGTPIDGQLDIFDVLDDAA